MQPRLLVVEDDPTQQAVLMSALRKRGFEVDAASDGFGAIRKLRANRFHMALIDYKLPGIDGFTSAKLLRDLIPEGESPKLIAVTAAAEDVMHRQGSERIFDAIIRKPFDLPALLAAIETHLYAISERVLPCKADDLWRGLGLDGAPAPVILPDPTPTQLQELQLQFDLTGQRQPELVLLLGPEASGHAGRARSHSAYFSLPFVDLTGIHTGADANFLPADRATWVDVAAVVARFTEGRRLIARSLLAENSLETRLLVYLFLSGRILQPSPDFASPQCVRYPGLFPEDKVQAAAERLARRGFLERRFCERFCNCACGSSRLNARKECPVCRSAHLRKPMRDRPIRQSAADVVDGVDCQSSIPERRVTCGNCGRSIKPVIGFACLDCGTHTDGAAIAQRDVCSYALTAYGRSFLARGVAPAITEEYVATRLERSEMRMHKRPFRRTRCL